MKKIQLLICLFIFQNNLFSQENIRIQATILEIGSSSPLPFVNVEFKNKNIKTVSDVNGKISLLYDERMIQENDTLLIYKLNYKRITVTANQLYKLLKNTDKIYLEPLLTKSLKGNSYLRGNVYDKSGFVKNASIKVKNTLKETFTDKNGDFRIKVNKNDIIIVSYLDMVEKEVMIADKENISIELQPNQQLLDEIIIISKRKEKEKDIYINTGWGIRKLNSLGSGEIITSKDIKATDIGLETILRGEFAGLRVTRNQFSESIYLLRGQRAKIVIDGSIYTQDDNLTIPYIDPQNIENIVVLKSLSSSTLYGGPAIIINTKTGVLNIKKNKKIYSALVEGNDYKDPVSISINRNGKSRNIIDLEKASTYKEALSIYRNQINNDNLIQYLIETATYFKKWNADKTSEILLKIKKLAPNNIKALRTIAFKFEELKMFDQAKMIYQEIAVLQPAKAQVYRDLSHIYQLTGNYKEAMSLYNKILNNEIKNIDFTGLIDPIYSELRHLLSKHRTKIDFTKVPQELLTADFKYDVRIVFEWNDPSSEFEIQFVNPEKKFYIWKHTILENREQLINEIEEGYNMKEFIIDDSVKEEWIINLEGINNEKYLTNPTYLKYSIYRNYGVENETVQVKVINLNNIKNKIKLFKL
jgi:tetratricopeptide (TPR) repeat protein